MRQDATNGKKKGYLLVTPTRFRNILAVPTVLKTGGPQGPVGSNPTPSAFESSMRAAASSVAVSNSTRNFSLQGVTLNSGMETTKGTK